MNNSSNKGVLIGGVVVLLVIAFMVAYAYMSRPTAQAPAPVQTACTQEAKLCPDGSYVGRTGPNCEFAACPGAPAPAPSPALKTFSDPAKGVSYQYADLTTTYITAQSWPPTVKVSNGPLTCTPGGSVIAQGGATTSKTIDGKVYCVTAGSEGAAGSVYTSYEYATEMDGKVVTLSFTLREVQCANYDDPKKTECTAEQASFNPDGLIATIASTLKLAK